MISWSLWREGAARPFVHPDYFFIVDVLQLIGQRMFADAWTGREMAVTIFDLARSLPSPAGADDGDLDAAFRLNHASTVWYWISREPDYLDELYGPTLDDWVFAYARWSDVYENFDEIMKRKEMVISYVHEAAVKGWLTFHTRHNSGEMSSLSASHWNADESVAYSRLASGKSDGEWLFVSREEAGKFLIVTPTFAEIERMPPQPLRLHALNSPWGAVRPMVPNSGANEDPPAEPSEMVIANSAEADVVQVPSLPAGAQAKHYTCKLAADAAAELMRGNRAIDRAEAIRQSLAKLANNPRPGSDESNQRAVRDTFNLLYDAKGQPHPK
jgi:hypothetical protein